MVVDVVTCGAGCRFCDGGWIGSDGPPSGIARTTVRDPVVVGGRWTMVIGTSAERLSELAFLFWNCGGNGPGLVTTMAGIHLVGTLAVRFETATGGVRLEGALVTCDPETGRASAIEPVRRPWPAT